MPVCNFCELEFDGTPYKTSASGEKCCMECGDKEDIQECSCCDDLYVSSDMHDAKTCITCHNAEY